MRKQYVKPSIANYGLCKSIIQGDCGWGTENITLDKTGYSRTTWKKWVAEPCAGPDPNGNTNCYAVCRYTTVCSNVHSCTLGARKKV